MCQSKAEGGKRCEYADQVANVRRKARYKHAGEYDSERQAQKAVDAWKRANPQIVEAHLPSRSKYQVKAGKKPVPDALLALLTPPATAITGVGEARRAELTKQLYEEHTSWVQRMEKDAAEALISYSITSYETINLRLRRSGLPQWEKLNYRLHGSLEHVDKKIRWMDEAFKTFSPSTPKQPRRVYRLVELPAGVRPSTYLSKYHQKGEGFMDLAPMSTTCDPEYLMAWASKDRNKKYMILEILTSSGRSLQRRGTASVSSLQSLEQEVLIPRRAKFRVVGKRRSQLFQYSEDRRDLAMRVSNSNLPDSLYAQYGKHKAGQQQRFPVVQLIEETLL